MEFASLRYSDAIVCLIKVDRDYCKKVTVKKKAPKSKSKSTSASRIEVKRDNTSAQGWLSTRTVYKDMMKSMDDESKKLFSKMNVETTVKLQSSSNHSDSSMKAFSKANNGSDPPFAYQETVRGKEARRNLPAYECDECARFYKVILQGKGSEVYSKEKLMVACRHRAPYPRPSTPEHFWETHFLDETPDQQVESMKRSGKSGTKK